MASKKISQLRQTHALTGSELFVFAKSGDNGAVSADTLKRYVKTRLAISDVAGLQTTLDAKAAKTDLQSISNELAERKKQFGKVGYVNINAGEFTNNSGYRNSGYIPINRALPIEVNGVGTTNMYAIAFFDANFNFVSGTAYPTNQTATKITCEAADIPTNAVYFVASTAIDRLDNSYYTNGETIESRENATSDAVAEAKKALFIDEWNMLFGENGKYDPSNARDADHPFLGNDIWMTYEEAMAVMLYGSYESYMTIASCMLASLREKIPHVRTTIPKVTSSNKLYFPTLEWLPYVEIIHFCVNATATGAVPRLLIKESISIYGNKLREIRDVLVPMANCKSFVGTQGVVDNTLTTLYLYNLDHDFNISRLAALSLASLQYLINNAANTTPITIEVHPSIYAKLTGGSGQYNLIKASNVEIDKTNCILGDYKYDDLETIKPGVKYKLTLCYQLGDKDDKLVASMTAGYGNDTGFDTKSATAVIETKVRDYSAVSNANQVKFSFYRSPNDNDFDPNTKVLWAVCVPDDGSDTPITEWIPAISELPEAEQEAAKWRQVNQLAAARGITFITAE